MKSGNASIVIALPQAVLNCNHGFAVFLNSSLSSLLFTFFFHVFFDLVQVPRFDSYQFRFISLPFLLMDVT